MITREKTNEFIDRAYKCACEHGFHDEELSVEHYLMLVLSEIGEMVEADRKNRHADLSRFKREYEKYPNLVDEQTRFVASFEKYVKDTLCDELADVVIRLFDFCGTIDYQPVVVDSCDLFRDAHGLKTICEQCFYMSVAVTRILNRGVVIPDNISVVLSFCFAFAEFHNIDLLWHIEKKMDYNASRVKLHGKKY